MPSGVRDHHHAAPGHRPGEAHHPGAGRADRWPGRGPQVDAAVPGPVAGRRRLGTDARTPQRRGDRGAVARDRRRSAAASAGGATAPGAGGAAAPASASTSGDSGAGCACVQRLAPEAADRALSTGRPACRRPPTKGRAGPANTAFSRCRGPLSRALSISTERNRHEPVHRPRPRDDHRRTRAPPPDAGRRRPTPRRRSPRTARPCDAADSLLTVGAVGQDGAVPRSTAPLVGRAAELASARRRGRRGPRRARPAAVVLGGDAGVGKTRLLAELISAAAADGVLCLIGHCVDLGDTPPPYLPFTEAFTRLAAEHPELGERAARRLPGAGPAAARPRRPRPAARSSAASCSTRCWPAWPPSPPSGRSRWSSKTSTGPTRPPATCSASCSPASTANAVAVVVKLPQRRPAPPPPAAPHAGRMVPAAGRHPRATSTRSRPTTSAPSCGRCTPTPMDEHGPRQHRHPGRRQRVLRRGAGRGRRAVRRRPAAAVAAGRPAAGAPRPALRRRPPGRAGRRRRRPAGHATTCSKRWPSCPPARLDERAARRDRRARPAADLQRARLHLPARAAGRGGLRRPAARRAGPAARRLRRGARRAAATAARPNSPGTPAPRTTCRPPTRPASRPGDEAMALAAPQEALQHYETALELAPQVPDAPERPLRAHPRRRRGRRRGRAHAARAQAGPPGARRAARRRRPGPPGHAAARLRDRRAGRRDRRRGRSRSPPRRVHLVPSEPPTAFRARLLAVHARVALIMGREVDAERTAREAVEVSEAVGCSRLGHRRPHDAWPSSSAAPATPARPPGSSRTVVEQAAPPATRPPSCAAGTAWPACGTSSASSTRRRTASPHAHQRAVETGPHAGTPSVCIRGR